jgi:hypothetical protein
MPKAIPLPVSDASSSPTALGEWDAGTDTFDVPPRGWVLGNTFCRGFVSSLIADGGVGKTSLRIAELLGLATGRSITGEHVFARCQVLIVSLEDDRDELRRRIKAAMIHHGIAREDLAGWLYLSVPRGLLLGARTASGARAAGALESGLRNTIAERGIDVVSIDPFVKAHGFDENENNDIDFAANLLARIAQDLNCAVDAPHHTNKGPAVGGDANRGRGASSFKDAARLVYTLTPMATEEAQAFGIDEAERRSLVRLDPGKVNIAPSAAKARWFRLVGVPLENGTDAYPAGDTVQTVEPWSPPDAFDGLDHATLNTILDVIEKGLPGGNRYSDAPKAQDRAAWRVILEHAPYKTEVQARAIIRTWRKTGLLLSEQYQDPARREPAKGLRVDSTKRPS